jgi:hypothetical protein
MRSSVIPPTAANWVPANWKTWVTSSDTSTASSNSRTALARSPHLSRSQPRTVNVADNRLPAATPSTGKSVSSRPSSNRIQAAMAGAPIACTTSTATAMRGARGCVAN